MAHGRARVFRRAIRRIAQRIHFALAEPAFAAGYGEGHHHPVADLQPFDIRSDLDDFAHEFVAQDIALLHLGNDTIHQMKVRAANGCGTDLEYAVLRVLDAGIIDRFAADVVRSVPD